MRLILQTSSLVPGLDVGKAVVDCDAKEFMLTIRPRKAGGKVRSFATNIYRPRNGEHFELVISVNKEETKSSKNGLTLEEIERL